MAVDTKKRNPAADLPQEDIDNQLKEREQMEGLNNPEIPSFQPKTPPIIPPEEASPSNTPGQGDPPLTDSRPEDSSKRDTSTDTPRTESTPKQTPTQQSSQPDATSPSKNANASSTLAKNNSNQVKNFAANAAQNGVQNAAKDQIKKSASDFAKKGAKKAVNKLASKVVNQAVKRGADVVAPGSGEFVGKAVDVGAKVGKKVFKGKFREGFKELKKQLSVENLKKTINQYAKIIVYIGFALGSLAILVVLVIVVFFTGIACLIGFCPDDTTAYLRMINNPPNTLRIEVEDKSSCDSDSCTRLEYHITAESTVPVSNMRLSAYIIADDITNISLSETGTTTDYTHIEPSSSTKTHIVTWEKSYASSENAREEYTVVMDAQNVNPTRVFVFASGETSETGTMYPPEADMACGESEGGSDYCQMPEIPELYNFESFTCSNQRWGSKELIGVLYTVARQWKEEFPEGRLHIGDLTAQPGHSSHQHGVDADLDATTNGSDWVGDYTRENYNRDATIYLAKLFADTGKIKFIFYNDVAVINAINNYPPTREQGMEMQTEPNHENHFHVRIQDEYRLSQWQAYCP